MLKTCPTCHGTGTIIGSPLLVDQIIERWAAHYYTTSSEIVSKFRDPNLVQARRQIVRELHEMGWGVSRIAKRLNRHHSSILYLLNGDRRRLTSDKTSSTM